MIYQEFRLPCKIDQGYCDPTTRTQATIVWFPEDTCTTIQVAKIHARMIKVHDKYFIESIPYEQVNLSHKRSNNFKNPHDIENKLTRFQIYQETEDKQPAMNDNWSESFLRKHEQRKSGKALTIPLKGKIVSETPSTIKTAAGAV